MKNNKISKTTKYMKKAKKKSLLLFNLFFVQRENNAIILKFGYSRKLVFNQSSPVRPLSESREGPLSLTNGGRAEILLFNIGMIQTFKL